MKSLVGREQLSEVRTNLVNTKVLKRIKEVTDEWVYVKRAKSNGGGYYLVPNQVASQMESEFGSKWNQKKPDRDRSPKQIVNDNILSGEAHDVPPWDIGENIIGLMKEHKLKKDDLSTKARNYVKEYLNARTKSKDIRKNKSGVARQVQPDEIAKAERKAIQEEETLPDVDELGGFLDGIVEKGTRQRPTRQT